ncbi:hypothetical protein [Alteromonas sp. KUL49]|uniref:hypothetical protein n=1 Tax=Alteromonas sp. KUL49 TaxID=2480798 RepID=UPI00102F0DB2|nr:hypothetical protein [Alteromonas sp. KUL49]TAP41443.1 hypothetical protein EYS00_04455 [Alteromonas sp. KUL49]GEA10520.1 hypothetical protein KUL49_08950 [Alteromonas sp. KUL49]
MQNVRPTVTFVTAVGNPDAYGDFDQVIERIKIQLDSMVNMAGNYKYVMVCNRDSRIEQLKSSYSKLEAMWDLVEVDFLPPIDVGAGAGSYGDVSYNKFMKDKGSRLIIGFQKALEYQSDYIFFVDCDDLLSCKIPSYLADKTGDIYYVNRGAFLDLGRGKIKPTAGLFRFCGSTVCYKTSFLVEQFSQIKNIALDASKEDIALHFDERDIALIFGDHMEWFHRFVGTAYQIDAFPFNAAAWLVNSGVNVSQVNFASDRWLTASSARLRDFGGKNDIVPKVTLGYWFNAGLLYMSLLAQLFIIHRSFKNKRLYFSLGDYMKRGK